jgi:two-component system LytT family response regulator
MGLMTKIRTLVVDDEPVARARVLALLREEPDVEVVGECANGTEAIAAIESAAPDLLFLDVQMPELDGLELAQALGPDCKPAIVFITAYDEYALRAFEIHALDYLLKPFSSARFKAALTHARARLTQRQATTLGRQLIDLLPEIRRPGQGRDRLVIKSGGRIYFVRTADIDWCEASGNYVRLHVGPQSHIVRETMAHLASNLDPNRFIRIHRSAIVNVDRIQELQSSFNGEYVVLLQSGDRLTLSRGYRDGLQAHLGKSL